MSEHVVNRGLDIPIQGAATGVVVPLELPDTAAYTPTELKGITPRLAVREGDEIKAGQVLFFHKPNPALVFRSPVAGRLKEVRRGQRRVITDIVVERDGVETEALPSFSADALRALSRDEAVAALLQTGLWALLKTRPLDNVPHPDTEPQAILINAMETGPLQPGPEVLLDPGDGPALQAAVHALAALTSGPVHLVTATGFKHPALDGLDRVHRHGFSGPHPAGDPAVQVNFVEPPRGSRQVFTIRAWDAVLIGRALLEGRYPADRIYAVVGAGAQTRRFVKTVLGAPLRHIVGETTAGDQRWIRGSVLTGEAISPDRYASFNTRAVHVLPDTVEARVLGWALPALGMWSFYKAFLSGFTGAPAGGVDMRPALHGGERAMVPLGTYNEVVATPDILPDFLFKAIIAGDLEESIQLGMLDISLEEAALCTYICPSKIEFDVLLKQGLDLYESEA